MVAVHDMRLSHPYSRAHPGPVTSAREIAVLGLGRMGAAIAARLLSLGWEVTGWTRSGRAVDTFTDIFLLVRVDGRWRIANKAYHRH